MSCRKRPRAIPSDYDPTYPYGEENTLISGSFINADKGLTNEPAGFLAIKTKPPLTFDNDGNLILAPNSLTVDVDTNKGLEKNNNKIAVKVASPIQFNSSGQVSIDTSYFTKPSDLSNYARLDAQNTFTEKQTMPQVLLKVLAPIPGETTTLTFVEGGRQFTSIDLNSATKITNCPNPTAGGDVVSKSFADNTYRTKTNNEFNGWIKVNAQSNSSSFIAFFNTDRNTRIGYIGKTSSNDGKITIQSNGDLTLECTGSQVSSNKPFSFLGNGYSTLGSGLCIGYGSANAYIIPEDASNKFLKFKGVPGKGAFTLDLQSSTRIINCPEPTAQTDVISKQYADQNYASKNNPIGSPTITLTETPTEVPLVSFNDTSGTRLGYVGCGPRGSGTGVSNNVYLMGANNIHLQANPNTGLVVSNSPFFYAGQKPCTLGNGVKLYIASNLNNNACFLTTTGGNGTLKFRDPGEAEATPNRIAVIDLEHKTSITNVPDPQRPTDAVNLRSLQNLGTLWTGAFPAENAKPNGTSGGYNCILTVTLTSIAGIVHGTVRVEGTRDPYKDMPLQVSNVVFNLNFDNSGALMRSSDIDTIKWGLRRGNDIVPVDPTTTNLLAFMPNTSAYPRGQALQRQHILKKCYFDASDNKLSLNIRLNSHANNYAIRFTFANTNSLSSTYKFNTSPVSFTYISQM